MRKELRMKKIERGRRKRRDEDRRGRKDGGRSRLKE